MANCITFLRLLLLYALVALAYHPDPRWQTLNLPMLIVIFVLDGVDGYVARRRDETSLFGAIFDITIDRIVENILWVVVMDLGFIPLWVVLVFLTRSFLVDSLRAQGASRGQTPFGMMRSPAGKFLVAGRFMRIFYGAVKAAAFGFIFMTQPWPSLWPDFYAHWIDWIQGIKNALVLTAVALCLLRGLPVLIEFAAAENGPLRRPRT
jgi:CDP-diacylglycerol--glycerol-3-phosphate 3-phosphatidyltransferase